MLKWFVTTNRRYAGALENRFPRIFGAPSYKDEVEARINYDTSNLNPKTIPTIDDIDRPLLSKSDRFTYAGIDIDPKVECDAI